MAARKQYRHSAPYIIAALAMLIPMALFTPASAADTACPQNYSAGQAPDILGNQLAQATTELCYTAFAVMHSGISRTPLWSAEHLTRDNVQRASQLPRMSKFHPEQRLPHGQRAELADYARSGYDRGHLAPNADMPDSQAQYDSHSLANIIPQDPACNRNIWERIERAVRAMASRTGELYVITGPLFTGDTLSQLNNRVLIPTHIYKVVYDPQANKGAAYLVKNTPEQAYETTTIAQIEQMAGIRFFPAIADNQKKQKLNLPEPGNGNGHAPRNTRENRPMRTMMKWLLR